MRQTEENRPQPPSASKKTKSLRPSWREGAIWMGASAPALWRLWSHFSWRIAPAYWLDAAIDHTFAVANSASGLIESLCVSRANPLSESPIFILGHWRTGTTLLHETLALDERFRAPTTYECFVPHHFRISQGSVARNAGFALPATRGVDNMSLGWLQPQEDEFALLNSGLPSPYRWIAFPQDARRDLAWLDLEGLPPTELARWERTWVRFLERVVAYRAGRLVLKSPPHTCRIPTILKLFPEAKFIYVVRNPLSVIPSTIRLWSTLWKTYAYQSDQGCDPTEFVLDTFRHVHERYETTSRAIPPENLSVVKYEDLTRDTLGTLRSVYEKLNLGGFETFEPIAASSLKQRSEYRVNSHEVAPELAERIRIAAHDYSRLHGYASP